MNSSLVYKLYFSGWPIANLPLCQSSMVGSAMENLTLVTQGMKPTNSLVLNGGFISD